MFHYNIISIKKQKQALNIAGAFNAIITASGFLNSGIEGNLKFLGPKGLGLNKLSSTSDLFGKIGKGTVGIGAFIDFCGSANDNFNNSNLSTAQKWESTGLDALYYSVKAYLTIGAGTFVGDAAIAIGGFVGSSLLPSTEISFLVLLPSVLE